MVRVMFATLLSVLPTSLLFAHEGHGHTAPGQGNSLWHYLTEPQHAWVYAAVIFVAAAAMLYRWTQRNATAHTEDLS